MTRRYFTFCDALDALDDYCAMHFGSGQRGSEIRRALLAAYDEVITAFEWSFLKATGRLVVHAAQQDGTVSYDSATRILTLSGNTWPDWAANASLHLDDLTCDVEGLSDATHLVLDAIRNPGKDLTAVGYALFERWLPLPDDFLSTEGPMADDFYDFGQEISLSELEARHRYGGDTGEFRAFAIGPNPKGAGMALYIDPMFEQDDSVDFEYRRRRRELRITGKEAADSAGTISTDGSTAVVGSGTLAVAAWQGAILRISAGTTKPTDLAGVAPYAEEHVIDVVADATHWTLKSEPSVYQARPYRVSDPIDLERHVWDFFLCCAQRRLARKPEDRRLAEAERQAAFFAARTADAAATPREVAGQAARLVPGRLSDIYHPPGYSGSEPY
jgi:hypothetical protein